MQGRLLEAGTHYLEAFRRNRNDSELAMRAACSMLQAGDRKEYESICQWMLERFGKTDDTSAACRTCFACLASSEPVGDLDELLRLANAGDGIPHQMACRARALVAYRAGNWEESLKWSESSRRAAAENTTMGRHYVMQSRILEALALHRLGKSAEASKAYEEATKIAREIFPDAPLYLNSAGYNDDWIEWVLYEPLHQEAKALVPLSPAVSLLELAGGSAAGVRQAIAQAKSLSWDGMEPRDLLICGELLLLGDEFEKAANALTQAVLHVGVKNHRISSRWAGRSSALGRRRKPLQRSPRRCRDWTTTNSLPRENPTTGPPPTCSAVLTRPNTTNIGGTSQRTEGNLGLCRRSTSAKNGSRRQRAKGRKRIPPIGRVKLRFPYALWFHHGGVDRNG